jgi:cold shock CspA family protein
VKAISTLRDLLSQTNNRLTSTHLHFLSVARDHRRQLQHQQKVLISQEKDMSKTIEANIKAQNERISKLTDQTAIDIRDV